MSNYVGKMFRGEIMAKSILVLIIIITIILTGCSKQDIVQNNEPFNEEVNVQDNEQPNKEEVIPNEIQQDITPTEAVVPETEDAKDTTGQSTDVTNNGGLYVGYKGNVYYRQYTADSYSPEGIWGTYAEIAGTPKNMMFIKQDGTSEIAFQDIGNGKIYIYNDRMYLEKPSNDYESIIYSVNLDGTKEQEIAKGWIKGIDEETGTLICLLTSNEGPYQLNRLDGATGIIKKYNLAVQCAEFLTIRDDVIYYRGEVDDASSQLGEMKLCSINIDGTDEKLLADTATNLYEFGNYGTMIPCIQFVGDTIYFSYGSYAGTGNFYQGGRIAKVKKDGSDFKILLGNEEVKDNNYDLLVNDIFYVASNNGKDLLYFLQSSEDFESFALDLSTSKVEKTNFTIQAEGKPFEYEKSISIYQNASPELTTWIPFVDYTNLELENEADYYTIKDIELCENWVYYRLEANELAPEASIGWRDGYRRIKTKVMREELIGDVVEILFEY